jgi:carbon monoxide dehydrogenase subunit G
VDIEGDYTFDAPQALVWQAIQDPDVLGSVMPGGEGFQKAGENDFVGKLKIKVGPVQGTFEGNIKLEDIVPPESYHIVVDGKGAPGFVKATGSMKLEARSPQQTYMQYSGTAQVGGRIASVGQRLMDSSARSIIRQSLDGLNEYLKVQAAQQPAASAPVAVSAEGEAAPVVMSAVADVPAAPVSEYKPPTQTQVALNVMRDVLNDLIPPERQPMVAIGVIALVVIVIWLLTR